MDCDEESILIGSLIIMEYVGQIVDAVSEDGIGEDNGGNEVEVSRFLVSMVNERMSVVEIVEVSKWEVPKASLFKIPSPIATFMSILDTCTGVPEVRTSSV